MTKKNLLITLFIVVIGSIVAWHWIGRTRTEADDAGHPVATTAPVSIVKRRDLGDTLTVSGAFKPFQDIDVHAKVAG